MTYIFHIKTETIPISKIETIPNRLINFSNTNFFFLTDLFPTTILQRRKLDIRNLLRIPICHNRILIKTPIHTLIPIESSSTDFSNILCDNNNNNCHDISIFQSGYRSDWSHQFLAIDYIFSRGNVLQAKEY